jgi:twitching motility protein PilT
MDNFDNLLAEAKVAGASDVHVTVNREPYFRINGKLQKAGDSVLKKENIETILKQLLATNPKARKELDDNLQADFSYQIPDGTRFRVNAFNRIGDFAIALRLISNEVKTIEELNLPASVLQFAELKQGFVLVTGPAGEGKSTTLAAILSYINSSRSEHIITIEDPMEYIFKEEQSIIDQREIGRDAASFPEAIRATLRQDPDVILIGELRDRESTQTALTLAETGHLVLASLHTNDAPQTVQRIIDTFPATQQSQIRSQLAASLSGIISIRLLPAQNGGRIPAVGIMTASIAIRNAIREDKTHQIEGIIQTSQELGMQTFTKGVQDLLAAGLISEEDVRPYLPEGEAYSQKSGK